MYLKKVNRRMDKMLKSKDFIIQGSIRYTNHKQRLTFITIKKK